MSIESALDLNVIIDTYLQPTIDQYVQSMTEERNLWQKSLNLMK